MDSGDDLSEKLSGLNMVDSDEENSSCDGSSEYAIGGGGERVPNEEPKDLPVKASEGDLEQLQGHEFTKPVFINDTIQEETCNISGCFAGVTFDDCLLLDDTKITDCCMVNVTFRGCTFTQATWAELRLEDVTFEGCVFKEHLWRCRSLYGAKFIKRDFLKETSLGEDIPPETNMAVWAEQQQCALLAPSIDDETYARRVQAELDGNEDFEPAAQQPAERDVFSGEASNAKSSLQERLRSEKVIQSRLFNDWNSPLWKSTGSNSKQHKVKSNKMTKDPAQKAVVAVPKRSDNISLANLGQQAPKPVNDTDLPVYDEKLTGTNGNPVFAASGAPCTPGTDSSVIAKRPTGVYGLPPHLRNKKA